MSHKLRRGNSKPRAKTEPVADFTRRQVVELLARIPHKYIGEGQRGEHRGRLAGVTFTGLDLHGLNFSRLDLRGACFAECNLTGADFTGSDCWEANFHDADLSDADLSDAELNSARLVGAKLHATELKGAHLQSADLSGATLATKYLADADFTFAIFRDASLMGVSFDTARLGMNDWTGATLDGCSFLNVRGIGPNPKERPAGLPAGVEWTAFDETTYGKPALPPTPTPPPPPAKPVADVWEVYSDDEWDFLGFLVTERDNRERPIAMVKLATCMDRASALCVADEIAANPDILDNAEQGGWDLRNYCRLDSDLPTPVELYGYRLAEVGHGMNGSTLVNTPFCRFRFAKMVAAHNRMAFTAEEREKFPNDTVGRDHHDIGGTDVRISIPASAIPL